MGGPSEFNEFNSYSFVVTNYDLVGHILLENGIVANPEQISNASLASEVSESGLPVSVKNITLISQFSTYKRTFTVLMTSFK